MSHPAIEAAKQNLAQMKRRAEEAGDEHIKAILNKVVADVEGSLVDVEGKMKQMDAETAEALEKANRQLEDNRARAKESVERPIAEAQAKAAQARQEILGQAGAGMPVGMGMSMPGMGMGFGGLPSIPRFDANAISAEARKNLGEAKARREQRRKDRKNRKGT
jgi:hypothetical protein